MQLSVPRYKAISVDRGANLDTIDVPLNNRLWLEQRFAEMREASDESERLAGIDEILQLDRSRPGRLLRRPRRPHAPAAPGARQKARSSASARRARGGAPGGTTPSRSTTRRSACTTPASIRAAQYKIRVVYAGDSPRRKIRLVAGEQVGESIR